MAELSNIDAVILCGGLGSRLRSEIGESQKVLAKVGGNRFLDILLEHLVGQGVKRVVLCVGYKADEVKKSYKNRDFDLQIEFSEEKIPLGTGGAIQHARNLIRSNPFFVLNGDSLCDVNLSDLLNFHKSHKASASIVVSESKGAGGFGEIVLGDDNHVINFTEKSEREGTYFVNAGVYLFKNSIFSFMPPKPPFSLEYDVFPRMAGKGLFGFLVGKEFIDIGTPERFKQAQKIFKKDK